MLRVMFLIPALEPGGAERQLLELVRGLDKTHFAVELTTFYDGGTLWSEAEGLPGVSIRSLGKEGPSDVVPFLWRLWQTMRAVRPHVIVGFMNFASDLSLPIGRLVGAKVAWSLRAANIDYSRYGWSARATFSAGAWLSRWADLIIVNSEAGRQYHIAHGYDDARMMVIPNGIDTNRFRPDVEARRRLRTQWQIGDHEFTIGLVGRIDAMKDHPTFLHAAADLARERADVHFVCVGAGPVSYTAEMQALGFSLGLGGRLLWTGAASDMLGAYNALDLLASSSYGEGFSNAIGEAMACGVPCVVTDVGDSARIVGETGLVVPPKDHPTLAQAWRRWLRFDPVERQARGRQARARIESEFNLHAMVAKTEAVLEGLVRFEHTSGEPLDLVGG